ncbi:MAG: DUF423 domain-containing protein [Planctomycetota bacterium]
MSFLPRLSFALGALLVAIAVGLSAWYAHGLTTQLDEHAYQAFGRGLDQQFIAGFGLITQGFLSHRHPNLLGRLAGLAMLLGAILFCGDVYLGALRGEALGVAPFGGSLSILAWLALGIAALLGARKG